MYDLTVTAQVRDLPISYCTLCNCVATNSTLCDLVISFCTLCDPVASYGI